MQTIKKSDSPLFYQLLRYGVFGKDPQEKLTDTCKVKWAIIKGIFLGIPAAILGGVAGIIVLFVAPLAYFGLYQSDGIITGLLTFASMILYLFIGITLATACIAGLFMLFGASYEGIKSKVSKTKVGKSTKNFTYQMNKNYTSLKERFCEKVEIIND